MSNYVTLERFRASAVLGDQPLDLDAQLAIDAAEESIEDYCNRRFYQSGTAVARYYTAESDQFVVIDDLTTLSSLKTDEDGDGTYEIAWTSGEYVLVPFNAEEDGEPYTRIFNDDEQSETFPATRKGVEVTGTWGWPAVPDRVIQATILQAARFLKRREAPFGVAGFTAEGGAIRLRDRLDPDVEMMLERLRRQRYMVA